MSDIVAVIDFGTTTDATVTSVGIQGISAADASLSALGDVDATSLQNGSILVYKTDTNKWTSTTRLNAQDIEAGEF